MSGEITQETPEAAAFQAAIQHELIQRTYSVEGDNVMAEFVFVMLCNQKTPEQITNELLELIGPEFEPSFTEWLFNAVAQHYPDSRAAQHATSRKAAAAPPPAAAAAQNPSPAQQQQPTGVASLPARPSPFGNVAAGIKRGHTESFSSNNGRSGSAGPPSQRQRTNLPDNVPKGPRNPQPTDGDPSLGPPRRSLQERMGGPPPGFVPTMTPMGPMLFNPQTGQGMPAPPELMEQLANGDGSSGDRNQSHQRGRGRGRGRDGNRRGDQGHQQQQAQPMMFPPGAMPMFFAPGPNGQPQPFFPQQQQQQMFAFPQPGMPGFPPHMAPPQQQQPPPQLPTQPQESGLCKYSTECKNAYCKFAHPSPAASKESGLVLSGEACEKQLACDDADCSKSHVSPQQKDPANSRPPPASEQVAQPFPQQMPMQQQFAGQTGARPCKFGASCTRPGCMFQHPWNNATPCRFGAACTRPDCYFSHPPGRKRGGARGGYANKGNRTMVFNQPGAAAAAGGGEQNVDEKLKATEAEKQALSDRVKRFSGPDGEQQQQQPADSAAPDASAAQTAVKSAE